MCELRRALKAGDAVAAAQVWSKGKEALRTTWRSWPEYPVHCPLGLLIECIEGIELIIRSLISKLIDK